MELEQTAYALDSTTIDLCLSLFPWAQFPRRKGAVKLHTLMDLRGNIPCFMRISHGKTHDVTVLDHLALEPGSFYMMDRGYVDFPRLHRFTQARPSSSRAPSRPRLHPTRLSAGRQDNRAEERPDDRLVGPKTSQQYPDPFAGSRSTTPRTTGGSCF